MSRIVNDLLLLAKAEAPDFLRLETVDVGVLTDELHTKVAALAPRNWTLDARGRGRVVADRPIVMLTARDGVADTVAGLEGGADYVTKPFRFEELLARVRARLREEHAPIETELAVGDLSLDLRTRQVRVDGAVIELSAREFALAELFVRHPGQVLSREQILSQVWGYDFDPGSNVVDVYVGCLRKKIGRDRIAAIRRMGYRLDK